AVDRPGSGMALVEAVAEAARDGGFSGLHLQWVEPGFALEQASSAGGSQNIGSGGWIAWRRQAYRWENRGYADFTAYLADFSKNMRRNVGRERAGLEAAGYRTRVVPAHEAGPEYWRLMAAYYERTNDKFGPWAARFLPSRFFELAPEYLGDSARFSAAFIPGRSEPVALALLFEGSMRLWGRYWGAESDVPTLHFETCYYRPIEYAIERHIQSFDPGMGGHHKARRGFHAVMATSLHRVFEPRLSSLFTRAVAEASEAEAAFADQLNEELPFRQDDRTTVPRPD
ncbi:MAG: GNAT family N-acetyltransferase, partial [Spirochaetales bacterium]